MPTEHRKQFIGDVLQETASITELCEQYGISRKTAYKWIERYRKYGFEGLEERSRRPHSSPHATHETVVASILEARRRHPSWGADKLLDILRVQHPDWSFPSRSTVCDILSRNGLITEARVPKPSRLSRSVAAANDVWSAGIRGHFRTRDGKYCYPLTIIDGFSRYMLACEALPSLQMTDVQPVFEHIFREFGLPLRISTGPGTPFTGNALARLSRLSAWWIRLGVLPDWNDSFSSLQQRVHEQMQSEVLQSPADNGDMQQRKFNRFRSGFNKDWLPLPLYKPSNRAMPDTLPPLQYPGHFDVRYVSANGGIRWDSHWINVSTVCAGDYVGLEEIGDGLWNVWLGTYRLGRLDERQMRIMDAYRVPEAQGP